MTSSLGSFWPGHFAHIGHPNYSSENPRGAVIAYGPDVIFLLFWICVRFRSRLADFFVNCQPEPRSLSGCLKENYADCLLAYSGLIGEFRRTLVCHWSASLLARGGLRSKTDELSQNAMGAKRGAFSVTKVAH